MAARKYGTKNRKAARAQRGGGRTSKADLKKMADAIRKADVKRASRQVMRKRKK